MDKAAIYLTRDDTGKYPSQSKYHLWLGLPGWDGEKEEFVSAGSHAVELCSVPDAIIALAEVALDISESVYIDDIQILSPALDVKGS